MAKQAQCKVIFKPPDVVLCGWGVQVLLNLQSNLQTLPLLLLTQAVAVQPERARQPVLTAAAVMVVVVVVQPAQA
jgi:hypothetical protein